MEISYCNFNCLILMFSYKNPLIIRLYELPFINGAQKINNSNSKAILRPNALFNKPQHRKCRSFSSTHSTGSSPWKGSRGAGPSNVLIRNCFLKILRCVVSLIPPGGGYWLQDCLHYGQKTDYLIERPSLSHHSPLSEDSLYFLSQSQISVSRSDNLKVWTTPGAEDGDRNLTTENWTTLPLHKTV